MAIYEDLAQEQKIYIDGPNSYGTTTGATAMKARPITREYGQLGHQIGELDEQIGQLEMLLQPILSPDREQSVSADRLDGPKPELVSEFAGQLRSETHRLTAMTQRIIRLQQRLEISS